MSQQSPPYVVSAASHSAALFRQALAASFVQYGVLEPHGYWCAQQASPNMSVLVGPGRVVLPGTQLSAPTDLKNSLSYPWTPQGTYFGLNDGPATVTLAASDPLNPRIDVVYVAARDAFYSGSNNDVVLQVATGVANSSPVAPAVPANAIAVAQIAVAANATTIVNANITYVAPQAVATGGVIPCSSSLTYPTNPAFGQCVYDQALDTVFRWNGSAWINIGFKAAARQMLGGVATNVPSGNTNAMVTQYSSGTGYNIGSISYGSGILTVAEAGLYAYGFTWTFTPVSDGVYRIVGFVLQNGGSVFDGEKATVVDTSVWTGGAIFDSCTGTVQCAAGDQLQAGFQKTGSGATLGVLGRFLSVRRVA